MKLLPQFESRPNTEDSIDGLGVFFVLDLELLRFLLDFCVLRHHFCLALVSQDEHAGRIDSKHFYEELLCLLSSFLCILPLESLEISSLQELLHEDVGRCLHDLESLNAQEQCLDHG